MPAKLRDLRFDQAANLVDDPANPKARIVLFKRAHPWSAVERRLFRKQQPGLGSVHVDSPAWQKYDAPQLKAAAEHTSGERNALPDSAFAAVWTDGEGHKQRKLPYKTSGGAIDLPHLRNGLARIDQTQMPAAIKPKARAKLQAAARSAGVGDANKESAMAKRIVMKRSVLRKMYQFFSKAIESGLMKDGDAGPLQDWASQEETEPEHQGHQPPPQQKDAAVESMKAHHAKLGEALKAYGDGAGLPADHPFHALKALHKELGDKIAEADAAAKPKLADADAEAEADDMGDVTMSADADADADADAGPRVQKLTKGHLALSKRVVDLQKKLDAADKRATEAETIAKSERDLRELESEKVTLRKFRHVTIDVEKEAPAFLKMRTADKSSYDLMMNKLAGAEAIAKKNEQLTRDIGSPLAGGSASAWAQIEAEAAKIIEKGEKGITQEKAIERVMKARPDLVRQHRAEQSGTVQ